MKIIEKISQWLKSDWSDNSDAVLKGNASDFKVDVSDLLGILQSGVPEEVIPEENRIQLDDLPIRIKS